MTSSSDASDVFGWSSSYLENYTQHRPQYPSQLFDIIFEYHKTHSTGDGTIRAAHDVGTGNGIVLARLLPHVTSALYASDISAGSIAELKKNFSPHAKASILHLEARSAEETDAWIPAASLDLVTVAEAIHWCLLPDTLASVAKVLKPGGTLAVWNYGPRGFFVADGTKEMQAVFDQLLHRQMAVSGPNRERGQAAHRVMSSKLDCVWIDSSLFTDEERWKWCTEGHSFLSPGVVDSNWHYAVGTDTVVHEDSDPQKWGIEVDVKWCRGYMESFHAASKRLSEECGELWEQLEKAMGDRKHPMSFPASLVLATKR